MAFFNNATHLNLATPASTSHFLTPYQSSLDGPLCNFEELSALPIEQAIAKLVVVIQIDSRFFIDNYDKLPPLSADQAIPLLTILTSAI